MRESLTLTPTLKGGSFFSKDTEPRYKHGNTAKKEKDKTFKQRKLTNDKINTSDNKIQTYIR